MLGLCGSVVVPVSSLVTIRLFRRLTRLPGRSFASVCGSNQPLKLCALSCARLSVLWASGYEFKTFELLLITVVHSLSGNPSATTCCYLLFEETLAAEPTEAVIVSIYEGLSPVAVQALRHNRAAYAEHNGYRYMLVPIS